VGDIAFEVSAYPERIYWVSRERGLDLMIEAGVITTVFMYAEGFQDHHAYTGALPGGIRSSDRSEDVRRVLGPPDMTGSGMAWEKWFRETWSLHVEYSGPGGAIQLVTLMTLESDPGLN
jgi:hypothetical protein